MGAQIRVTVTGNRDGARYILESARRLRDTAPLIESLTSRAAASQRRNIDESHSPDGTAYDALKPATIRAKERKGYSQPSTPLKATLVLYESIHSEIYSASQGWAGPHALTAYYFPYQNQGAPRANIPERRFIGLSLEDETANADDVREFAMAAVS